MKIHSNKANVVITYGEEDKMAVHAQLTPSYKLIYQNGEKNCKKKDNVHQKRMWQKNISRLGRILTIFSCDSFCFSGNFLGLYSCDNSNYNYDGNGKSSISSLFLKKLLFVFLWIYCCFLCPSSCDIMRGKKKSILELKY